MSTGGLCQGKCSPCIVSALPREDDAGEDVADDAEDGEGAQAHALHPELGLKRN